VSNQKAENPLAKFLTPETREVAVGEVSLRLDRLTIHRHRGFWGALAGLQIEKLAGTFSQLFSGEVALTSVALTAALNLLAVEGPEAIALGIASALDTEENFRRLLKTAPGLPEGTSPVREHGHYVGCEAVREWIGHYCEVPQALHIVGEIVTMNAYGDLGKALLGAMEAATKGLQKIRPPGSNASEPATAEEIVN